MVKLILKSPYIKCGGDGAVGGYMRYIATREHVQLVADDRPTTKKQEQLVRRLTKDFPDTKELFEYEDYASTHTKAAASAFITIALETNWQAVRRSDGYMKYIATRPRAERLGSHGLFGDEDSIDLGRAMAELDSYTGNVWTHIISLQREDAARLGYDSAGAWRSLLKARRNEIAEAMHIPPNNLRWYAAFHDEGKHPHVHMMAWSTDPAQGYLDLDGIYEIRSKLTNDIFKQEMLHLYEQKSQSRDELVRLARRSLSELTQEMRTRFCDYPEAEQLMTKLARRLETVTGKKKYGYLPKAVKALVDEIVDHMEELPSVSQMRLLAEQGNPYAQYQTGKLYRDGGLLIPDWVEAREWFALAAEQDMSAAQYALGKLLLSDDIEVRNPPEGMRWLEKAYQSGSTFAAYRLAKEYLRSEITEKDAAKAARYLNEAAEGGNQQAQYLLSKLLLSGREIAQDRELARHWLTQSAGQGNPYAQFILNRIDEHRPPSVMLAVTRLFHHLGNIFKDNSLPRENPPGFRMDRKRRRKLMEKRQAMGIKGNPGEEQSWMTMHY